MSRWRDAVRDELAVLRRRKGQTRIGLQELLDQALPRLRAEFPDNDHPDAKVRQQLQELRDRGELRFVDDRGSYEILSLDRSRIDQARVDRLVEETTGTDSEAFDAAVDVVHEALESRTASPERVQRLVDEFRRNERIVAELKELYDHRCQVCGTRRKQQSEEGYAEGHHIRPLGEPHAGPDTRRNLLVVCPNHHVDFDYGMLTIDPRTHTIEHAYDEDHLDSLHVERDHDVGEPFLRYHNREIARL